MKKFFISLVITMMGVAQLAAMTNREIRENARFLSDRMAYELNLTPQQYEDCFEINYDFLSAIDSELDGMCYGYESAINSYYDYLDYRNEDLRYVLNNVQYASFYALDYFFRPIYTTAGRWALRIFDRYSNRNFFYYDAPRIYWDYRGAHGRRYYGGGYYGGGRYNHHIHEPRPIHHHSGFDAHRRNDFGHHPGPDHHQPAHHRDNYGGGGHHDNHGGGPRHDNHGGGPRHDNGGHPGGGNYNHNSNHNSNFNSNHNSNYNGNHNGNGGGARHDNGGGARHDNGGGNRGGGARHDGGTRGGGGGHDRGGHGGGGHDGGHGGGGNHGGGPRGGRR